MFVSIPKGLTGTPGVQGAEGKPGPLVGYLGFIYTFGGVFVSGTMWINFRV